MKIFLTILFLLFSGNLYAECNDVDCTCVTKKCRAERDVVRTRFYCIEKEPQETRHKALLVKENKDGTRIIYLFKITDSDVVQVGVIDESVMKIYTIENGSITSEFGWMNNDDSRRTYQKEHFPNLTELEIFKR